VREVFHSVASRYDVMNDLMSMGLHRVWKRFLALPRACARATRCWTSPAAPATWPAAWPRPAPRGWWWHTDINGSMLRVGRDRMLDKGLMLPVALCDAEKLPFPATSFDLVTVAFGLRNMTHKERRWPRCAACSSPAAS
jgi:demethylmenaquinone methyltransferase/2-methoxy-6-polyprenyl-1,4-benzoquinol methylase